jgi:hypothetical protein
MSRNTIIVLIHCCHKHIKIGPREIEWGGIDWIHLAQDRDW